MCVCVCVCVVTRENEKGRERGGERRKRASTENLTSIIGLKKAVEVAKSCMEEEHKRITELRNYLIEQIEKEIPHVLINGHREKR